MLSIEEYLNTIPLTCKMINMSSKNLTELPNLSRFKNLEILICDNNNITSLPKLNKNLKMLICNNNQLSSLPRLPKNLEMLMCNNNNLSSLPKLNENLTVLSCNDNQLLCLPRLNKNLKILNCYNNLLSMLPVLNNRLTIILYYNNPIWDIISTTQITEIKTKINILNNFKSLYYLLKYKQQFIKWYWRPQEQKIRNKYSPHNLIELLETRVELDDDNDLESLLKAW